MFYSIVTYIFLLVWQADVFVCGVGLYIFVSSFSWSVFFHFFISCPFSYLSSLSLCAPPLFISHDDFSRSMEDFLNRKWSIDGGLTRTKRLMAWGLCNKEVRARGRNTENEVDMAQRETNINKAIADVRVGPWRGQGPSLCTNLYFKTEESLTVQKL